MGGEQQQVSTFKSELYQPRFEANWHRHTLYDLAEWVNGLAFRNIHFSPQGKPVIKIAEIKNGISGQTKFTEGEYDPIYHVTDGEMLFSWSGQPETSIDVFIWRGPNGWLNQHIFKVHPKECCEEQFFFYLLKYLNPNFVRIARNKQTTGLGHVTKKDLQNISVKLPLPPEQRAIFKSWFIDFDPVIDNALRAGNPIPDSMAERAEIRRQILDQNQNDELRIVNSEKRKKIGLENSPFTPHNSPFDSLFPDSFEDSEVGEIPTGWEVKAIGDVAEFAYGKALKASDRKPGDVPVFGSNGQVGLHNEALVKGPGIVIGRKGNPGIVTWLYEDFSPLIQPSMSREQELF